MLLITLLVLLATSAMAQPLPPLDSGICPLGYIREASYCVPTSPRRAVAIPKVGEYRQDTCNSAHITASRCARN
jgi:hypothetical protein